MEQVQSDTGRFLKTGVFSLLLHVALMVSLTLSLNPAVPKGGGSIYRVTLRPFSSAGGGMGQTAGSEPGTGPSGGLPVPSVVEKPKMKATSARSETSESVKPPKKKAGKKAEKPENGELALVAKKEKSNKPLRDREVASGMKNPLKKGEKVKKESDQSLQEAMEEIRKKAAIDEIQKRVAQRSKSERERAVGPVGERTTDGQPVANPSQGPIVSSSRDSSPSGSGLGTATGSGPGTGTGPGPGPGTGSGQGRGTGSGSSMGTGSGGFPGGSPWGSPYGSSFLEPKLNDYYSMVWAKIKEEWTLPENFPKEERTWKQSSSSR